MNRIFALVFLLLAPPVFADDVLNPFVFRKQERALSALTSLADNTIVNVTASPLTLTKGTWIMCGSVYFDLEAATSASTWDYGISTTTATLPNSDDIANPGSIATGNWRASIVEAYAVGNDRNGWIPCYPVIISSSSKDFYLVMRVNWSGTSAVMAGSLWAWRVR